ncbi:hypothetical protein [Methylocystis sp. SB2]|uniref:hypothetical protein n=1 Tax=Methylocystis sp. (strain SB2) TaxID=743836 RepID=UPI0004251AA9|nr:hypothetical protein [Methylocystis sp. SB2]ULO25085.1 hypothetical protein LNB28_06770 [Methylocystis sp. SB2]
MTENPYERWLRTEIDLCLPVIDQQRLNAILGETAARVFQGLGQGPVPKVILDLEHLQAADYGTFEGVTDEQRQFISKLHAAEPIRPEEMMFLALRSLFQFTWPKPQSEDDIRFAAAYDFVLDQVLVDTALNLAGQFRGPDALLPYWGQLSFLRVMVGVPLDNITRYGLDRVSCTLVKRAKFNATTFVLDGGALIGMNYALEPILKHLNRYLLHYFCTREMAGPKRLSRAWEGIVPTVLHFWSDVAATRLTSSSTMLYDEEMGIMAHRLTAEQLDFIVMHELGHFALDHPLRLKAESVPGRDVTTIRHKFEFEADAFALGLMRSRLVKIRTASDASSEASADVTRISDVTAALHDYRLSLGAVYLLFAYMDFIQRAGEFLRERLGGRIEMRTQMDTHPRASARLEHLELTNLGEYLYTSPLERYATGFLQSVLDYAAGLDDQSLVNSVIAPVS